MTTELEIVSVNVAEPKVLLTWSTGDVVSAIDKLGGRDRSFFVARTIEGMTLDEVAAAHEVSVSTAQRRINRASKRIATLVRRDPVLARFADQRAGQREAREQKVQREQREQREEDRS